MPIKKLNPATDWNRCRDPQPNIGQSSEYLTEEGGRTGGASRVEETRGPQPAGTEQGSETLNQQSGSLHGFGLGTLHMCYDWVAWRFWGTLDCDLGYSCEDVSGLFAYSWGDLFPAGLFHLALI